jgi:hypothetical protein
MKNITIKAFCDAGHGWGRVFRTDLRDLNILQDITSFSYQKNRYVYLEEDCDLSTYVNALKNLYPDIEINFKTVNNSNYSSIRTYDNFHLNNEESNKIEIRKHVNMIVRRLNENRDINKNDYNIIKLALNEFLKM